MRQPLIAHGQFTIEREYRVPANRVFEAWSDPDIKSRWFKGPESWTEIERELDFRVGGIERLRGKLPSRETFYSARFHQIVENERIVYVYDMYVGDVHHSLSLATVEFSKSDLGTRMLFNEQIAFLDGTDARQGTQSRELGVSEHFDYLTPLLND